MIYLKKYENIDFEDWDEEEFNNEKFKIGDKVQVKNKRGSIRYWNREKLTHLNNWGDINKIFTIKDIVNSKELGIKYYSGDMILIDNYWTWFVSEQFKKVSN